MSTPVNLATGLGGAIGCDYRASTSQLIFVEYDTGKLSALKLGVPPAATYSTLGTGYTNPEDVELSSDGVSAYVTERSGDLVKVALSTPNRASAKVVASGMTAPQQLALDEAHNTAYVVEYASPGNLYKINLTTGVKTSVAKVTNAVGLALSADLQYAYISQQPTGGGTVSRIRLSDGTSTTMVTGLTAPFFLSWQDAAQSTLLVPERDPANRITAINVSTFAHTVVVTGVATRPSSVYMLNPNRMLICCDSAIQSNDFLGFGGTTDLLMGIGFVPFSDISVSTGLATTPSTYFYQVSGAPFGGSLPIMINFQQANTLTLAYYRVRVDGVYRSDSYTDQKFNGTVFVPTPTTPATIGGLPSYPVHPTGELFDWMNPTLGCIIDSTNLANGIHHLVVEFVPAALSSVTSSETITLRVDNENCIAACAAPTLDGNTADTTCGLLRYPKVAPAPPANQVVLAFTASQPNNFATYTFSLIKGANTLNTLSGPVNPPPAPFSEAYTTLLGTCSASGGIAAFAEYLDVYSTIINGWSRQSQYDASAAFAFTLAPQAS